MLVAAVAALGAPTPSWNTAHPTMQTDGCIASRSANGGLAVSVRATGDDSLLDVCVNFELEVNVWRDLSPDVEQMNTDGPLAQMRCRILSPPEAIP